MRRTTIIFFVLLLLSLNLFGQSINYQLDLVTNYIWRGFDLNPLKQPAVQPSLTYTIGESGFSINLWCSFALGNSNDDPGWEMGARQETDLTLNYDIKTDENISLSLGFTHYGWYFSKNFKFGDHTTQEFYITTGLPKILFKPNLTVYYDISNGDGLYLLLAGAHEFKLGEKLIAEFYVSLGFNGGQWLPEGSKKGLSDINLGLSIPFKAGDFSITPFARLTVVLLDSIGKDEYIWFGITISK